MSQRHVVLIACGKRKATTPRPAAELYRGDLFIKSFRYAESLRPTAVRILSAKHHVIHPQRKISPYNLTLNTMSASEIRRWAERVIRQLEQEFDLQDDRFTVLAGANYRRYLEPHLRHCEVPMEGLGIGKQLSFLKRRITQDGNTAL